jgi:hypothetical protein
MIDGVSRPAFSMATIEPFVTGNLNRAAIVREQSRRRYAQPARQVEAVIERAFAAA